MDADRFDTLARVLTTTRSRRRALAGGLASALSAFGHVTTEAQKNKKQCPPCKKRKQGKCKTKLPDGTACTGGTCRGGSCVATSVGPPPSPQLVYQCPGPSQGTLPSSGNGRFAQTFFPSQSGSLRQIEFGIVKEGTAGDYVVQLLQVSGGTPGSSAGAVLASVTIPDAAVPNGPSTLVANFSGPALEMGTEYAAAITRPASAELDVQSRGGTVCAGQGFGAGSTGAFNLLSYDLIVAILLV